MFQDVAEFLSWAFEVRNSYPRTLQSYRSAISVKMRLATGYDPGQDNVLTLLLKSFFVQKPIKDRSIIKWDLNLVLHYLKQGKMQATVSLTPREVTLKTVFLLALTGSA